MFDSNQKHPLEDDASELDESILEQLDEFAELLADLILNEKKWEDDNEEFS